MAKIGDIIDGKRVTKVFWLCGGLAYQSEPVKDVLVDTKNSALVDEAPKAEEAPKRRTRKK